MEILFYNVYKTIYLISMCVWECTPASMLHTLASACALNFWWILNISGSDKVKKRRKKNRFDTIAYERHDPWHTQYVSWISINLLAQKLSIECWWNWFQFYYIFSVCQSVGRIIQVYWTFLFSLRKKKLLFRWQNGVSLSQEGETGKNKAYFC